MIRGFAVDSRHFWAISETRATHRREIRGVLTNPVYAQNAVRDCDAWGEDCHFPPIRLRLRVRGHHCVSVYRYFPKTWEEFTRILGLMKFGDNPKYGESQRGEFRVAYRLWQVKKIS